MRRMMIATAALLALTSGCDGDRTPGDATTTDDAACRPEDMCMVDFPCDHPSVRDRYQPHCGSDTLRVLPHTLSCEEACGTPCCSGGACEWTYETCPDGTVCRLRSGYPACVPPCEEITTFADTTTALRWLYVSPRGDDATGDGTAGHPYRTLAAAARIAVPGDWIFIDGSTSGDNWIEGLQGTVTNPIRIFGSSSSAAWIEGGVEGIHLVDPAYVVLENLVITGQTGNGINIDDGGDYATPAHHVILRNVTFTNIGPGGNNDCLKLSGLDDFFVLDNTFTGCGVGGPGSGIDMVGCHDGTIARNSFSDMGANSVQAKGGSARVTIRANRTESGGERAFNMGGSTGLEFFRPLGADYEAQDIRAVANVIVGSEAAIAFVGCDGCLAANNTIIRPTHWVARILQESVTGFVPCRNGRFINNLVVFRQADLSTFVNVGPDTAPDTFTFADNLWFAEDDPSFTGPDLPVAETGTVIADPLFVDGPGSDYHVGAGSPADGAGTTLTEVTADFDGNCYQDPPAIGAFERP